MAAAAATLIHRSFRRRRDRRLSRISKPIFATGARLAGCVLRAPCAKVDDAKGRGGREADLGKPSRQATPYSIFEDLMGPPPPGPACAAGRAGLWVAELGGRGGWWCGSPLPPSAGLEGMEGRGPRWDDWAGSQPNDHNHNPPPAVHDAQQQQRLHGGLGQAGCVSTTPSSSFPPGYHWRLLFFRCCFCG